MVNSLIVVLTLVIISVRLFRSEILILDVKIYYNLYMWPLCTNDFLKIMTKCGNLTIFVNQEEEETDNGLDPIDM